LEIDACEVGVFNSKGSRIGSFRVANDGTSSLLRTLRTQNEELEERLRLMTKQMVQQKESDLETFKRETADLHNQYISTKMKLSEMQMQNNDLERELFELKKSLKRK
jgi:chromosome segregation ATPase